ncbi:4-hydroxythreonine-4-phosphate dehydrogenase PdxA [Gangjinia marincola]|uniref:4-hydroxythreonine-4-phosphate dehydrogenase PdxA n=1 Tax=Gangjinia marincola TaxID=578463 RepID=A0ABN1MHQ9_9FLAO
MNRLNVGISIGDINGIGPEIILKTFADSRMTEFCTPVIFANVKLISFFKKQFNLQGINVHGIDDVAKIVEGKINLVNVWSEATEVNFGKEDSKAGEYAIRSLKASVKALKDQAIDVLVTAPIHKKNIQSSTFSFPGHTDFLAQELDGEALMFMVTDSLKVGLITDHVPVKDVSSKITPALIKQKVFKMHDSLVKDFGVRKPKIAVLGINPHSGDDGVIGNEDQEVMIPTLDELRAAGKLVFGPYAADAFFGSGNYKNFDAVLAAYHDQGLIPFKTLSFGEGVNYTAGLSHVRTSPDHGVAYDIAGKGIADESSFKKALFEAISIHRKREEYAALTADVLKKQKRAR